MKAKVPRMNAGICIAWCREVFIGFVIIFVRFGVQFRKVRLGLRWLGPSFSFEAGDTWLFSVEVLVPALSRISVSPLHPMVEESVLSRLRSGRSLDNLTRQEAKTGFRPLAGLS